MKIPIHPKYKGNRIIGYQWGNQGKVYLISKYGGEGALNEAQSQGKAIHASSYTNVKKHKRKGKKIKRYQRKNKSKVKSTRFPKDFVKFE